MTGIVFQEVYPALPSRSDGSTLLEEHLNWKNPRMALTQNLLVIPYLTGEGDIARSLTPRST